MAEAHPASESWTQRLVDRPPWSPWRLSLAIAGALTAVFLAAEAALGRLPLLFRDEHVRGDFRIALVLIALTAYLPGALLHLVRGARATTEALAPALRLPPAEQAALRAGAGRSDPRALRRAGAIGLVAMLLLPLVTNVTIATWDLRTLWPEAIVHRLLLPGIGWFAGRFVHATLVESRRLSRIGLRGARDAIAAAKRAELAASRQALRAARADALGARPLADVLAWRGFVESVPEWPFDAPTLLRLALYLAIPVGSWLGGALVERLVDALLS
ncbi:MAG TPA: hypothetical protein VLC53_02940 [Myxococcota bacterium]|nr:hypothetical protein [Myxococcota bacterium]